MAVDYNRQYVGARYVPKFFENVNGSWDWAAGFQYEPLTIVKYGENTYTSKKLVPSTVGSPNENPEYWANTGNYNGAINELGEKVNNLASTYYYDRISLNKRKFVIVGDSYSDEYGDGSVRLSYKAPYYMQQALGIPDSNFINVAISGSSFTGEGGGTLWVNQLYNPRIGSKEDVTDIVCVGGINDSFGNNTLVADKMREFVSTAKTMYPNATLWLGYAGWAFETSSVLVNRGTVNRLSCISLWSEAGNSFGFNVNVDLWKSWAFGSMWYYQDLLHPSYNGEATGAALLGGALANWIKGNPTPMVDYTRFAWNTLDITVRYMYGESEFSLINDTGSSEFAMPGNIVLTSEFQDFFSWESDFFFNFPWVKYGNVMGKLDGNNAYMGLIIQFKGKKFQVRAWDDSLIGKTVTLIQLDRVVVPRYYMA